MNNDHKNNLYDIAAIKALHEVPGFDPRKYMRIIGDESGNKKYYLDVAFRKLWFRLIYPQGKIIKKIVQLTEQSAVIEARIYLDKSDPEDAYVSNAYAKKELNDLYGYVEFAETAAIGRALADAGFGTQFTDMEGDFDPCVADAPISVTATPETKNTASNEEILVENTNAAVANAQLPHEEPPVQNNKPVVGNPDEIDTKLPVEEIYKLLTPDMAAAVVVSAGCHRGKTLGKLAVEKPGSIKWYITSYTGNDNLLRAAAKYLLDTALEQAS